MTNHAQAQDPAPNPLKGLAPWQVHGKLMDALFTPSKTPNSRQPERTRTMLCEIRKVVEVIAFAGSDNIAGDTEFQIKRVFADGHERTRKIVNPDPRLLKAVANAVRKDQHATRYRPHTRPAIAEIEVDPMISGAMVGWTAYYWA